MHRAEVVISKVARWINGVAAVTLVAMMLVTVINMIMREVYVPFTGSAETVGFLGAVTAGLALGYTQIKRGHINVDVVVSRFPPKIQGIVDSISYFVSMAIFGVAAWQVFSWANRLMERREVSESGTIVFYPFVYVLAFGCAGFCLVLLIDCVRATRR